MCANSQSGFIALISAILISVSLLVLVVAVGFGGFFGRFAILDSEVKEVSSFLAEACVNTAIIELTQDDEYDGGETILVGTSRCRIVSVVDAGGGDKTIRTQASSTGAYTNLEVVVNSDEEVVSWLELPSF